LNAGKSGQWEAGDSKWYQEISSGDEGGLAKRSTEDGDGALGVTTERVSLGRTTALKVTRVRPNSAAATAGVEPGDILVEANRRPVSSQRELDDLYRSSRDQFSLTVRDVRSARDVLVNVDPYSGQPGPEVRRGRRSLGVTGKLAFYQGEPAVEVTEVASGSPADRAGIAPGDLILEADGKTVESAESLDAITEKSRGVLGLKVADPKSRQERTIRVAL
jgi:S1-C subfamily serine protease